MEKLFFVACAVGLIGAAIALGGPAAIFVNLPSAMVVFGGLVFCLLAHFSFAQVKAAFTAPFSSAPLEAEARKSAVAVLTSARMIAVGLGCVGSLIGLVQMLANMDDPSAIGPAMAVALLTLFYAVLLSELVLGPLAHRVHAGGAAGTETKLPGQDLTLLVFLLTGASTIGSFFVLLLSFSSLTA